jgi:hypothetical protein
MEPDRTDVLSAQGESFRFTECLKDFGDFVRSGQICEHQSPIDVLPLELAFFGLVQ